MSTQEPLLHETEEEDNGYHVSDKTKCKHCGKPLAEWKAREWCPARQNSDKKEQR